MLEGTELGTTEQCLKCDESCGTCSGGTVNDCLSCANGYIKDTTSEGKASSKLIKEGESEPTTFKCKLTPGTFVEWNEDKLLGENPNYVNMVIKDDHIQEDAIYQIVPQKVTTSLKLPEKLQYSILTLTKDNTGDNTIKIESNQKNKITISATADSTPKLVVNPESTIDLTGAGDVTLNKESQEGSITINAFVPESGSLNLASDSSLVINKVEVPNAKQSTLQGTGSEKTTCPDVNVNQNSEFTLSKVGLQKIATGLNSIIKFGEDIKYNGVPELREIFDPSNLPEKPPFQFSPPFVAFPEGGSLIAEPVSTGNEQADQDKKQLLIASFTGGDGSSSKDTCETYKKGCKSIEGFEEASCVDAEGATNLVAIKKSASPSKKDKKLSGGAIAGIVIACVVVVAAIIALLVYFLVIKKKKDSTTSTQGDSSIAI